MAAIAYTKKVLIQRVRKAVSNSRFVKDDFVASDNEILLLIDQAAAARIVGQAYMGAKVEGALVVPEAYLITYSLGALTYDSINDEWYAALPQPPLSLPIGYSVSRCYFADSANGPSMDIFFVKAKRVGYRNDLPRPAGTYGRIENNTLRLQTSNGQPLFNQNVYIQMPSARTTDVNAVMNMPEDDIEFVFNDAVMQLMKRYGVPQDIIADNLPAGNKSS